MSAISRAMVDVMVMALACDQTRVFSDWFSHRSTTCSIPTPPRGTTSSRTTSPRRSPRWPASSGTS